MCGYGCEGGVGGCGGVGVGVDVGGSGCGCVGGEEYE